MSYKIRRTLKLLKLIGNCFIALFLDFFDLLKWLLKHFYQFSDRVDIIVAAFFDRIFLLLKICWFHTTTLAANISTLINRFFKFILKDHNFNIVFHGGLLLLFLEVILIICVCGMSAERLEYINTLEKDIQEMGNLYIEEYQENQELYELIFSLNDEKAVLEALNQDLTNGNTALQKDIAKTELSTSQLSEASIRSLITVLANKYNVDPYLALAISRHETGNWKSDLCLYSNNFGGMKGSNGWLQYSNALEGITAFCKTLNYYNTHGMSSIESMAYTYCPDETDHWIACVTKFYREEQK